MKNERFTMSMFAATLLLSPALASAEDSGPGGVGVYTAVMGKVTVTHSGEPRMLPVKLHDEVMFRDVIQTEKESRTKAFFQDDSILTVGENSLVEITEYIYNPEANLRRSVVKVMQGQVRALVSKVFKSNGSRFEVHTPSAVAAARGTYFTVWHENGQSGIINVGESGRVDFTSGGVTVAVDPGQFSLAEHGKAPSLPVVHGLGLNESAQTGQAQVTKKDGHGPTQVDRHGEKKESSHVALVGEVLSSKGLARAILAVENTTVHEARPVESPMQAAQAMHHDLHLAKDLVILNGVMVNSGGENCRNWNCGSGNSGGENSRHGNSGSGNSGSGNSGPGDGTGTVTVVTPVTPLAVFTGASDGNGSGSGSGNSGPGGGTSTSAVVTPVTPLAVFTGASDGSGSGHSGRGNGYSHGHH
jgi:hypothetical protein